MTETEVMTRLKGLAQGVEKNVKGLLSTKYMVGRRIRNQWSRAPRITWVAWEIMVDSGAGHLKQAHEGVTT